MRYRLLASYEGAPYEAGIGPDETGVVLFAACPPPEDLRFEPATGHWRKEVNRADVQMIYESRPVGTFRGERCVVLDDLNDRLHIAYLGHDAHLAERLGYWEVDRGVFELITPRPEVTDVVEQRLPLRDDGPTGPLGADLRSGPGRSGSQLLEPEFAGQAADRGDVSVPVVDEGPLPLEAAAMRAASQAVRMGKNDRLGRSPSPPPAAASGQTRAGRHEFASEDIAASPAGLSEPSNVAQQAADPAAAVPSWTPQAHVTPHRPAHAETPGTAETSDSGGAVPKPAGPGEAAGPVNLSLGAQPLPDQVAPVNGAMHERRVMPVGTPLKSAPTRDYVTEQRDQPLPPGVPDGGTSDSQTGAARGAAVAASAGRERQDSTVALAAAPLTAVAPPAPTGMPEQDLAQAEPVLPDPAAVPRGQAPGAVESLDSELAMQQASRHGRTSRRRLPTKRIFSELAAQAAIPANAYAIGEDVEGAMCLVKTDEGFEVFNSLAGARHEVRVFPDEESAYFYLFGVLVADAVRTGMLAPKR